MINAHNEIRYMIAFGMLKKLFDDGLLSCGEFEAAHSVVIEKYSPLTVRRLL